MGKTKRYFFEFILQTTANNLKILLLQSKENECENKGEHVAQLLLAVVDVFAHVVVSETEPLCNLFGGEVVVIVKRKYLALLGGHAVYGNVDDELGLDVFENLCRRNVGGEVALVRWVGIGDGIGASSAAVEVNSGTARHDKHEGFDVLPRIEPRAHIPHSHKHILHNVFGILAGARYFEHETEQGLVISGVEFSQGMLIPAYHLLDDIHVNAIVSR